MTRTRFFFWLGLVGSDSGSGFEVMTQTRTRVFRLWIGLGLGFWGNDSDSDSGFDTWTRTQHWYTVISQSYHIITQSWYEAILAMHIMVKGQIYLCFVYQEPIFWLAWYVVCIGRPNFINQLYHMITQSWYKAILAMQIKVKCQLSLCSNNLIDLRFCVYP